MNTNNVYYGALRVTTEKKREGNYFVEGITTTMTSKGFKPVLILVKKNIFGKRIIIDLNTGEKYTTKIPLKIGELFIKMDQMVAFNLGDEKIPPKLPKKDVLKIGNEVLKEIRKEIIELSSKEAKQKIK